MNKIDIYVDMDYLKLGSIELTGRIMNAGIYPTKVVRSHKSGHWLWFFKTDERLKKVLDSVAEPEYNLIYNEDQGEII